MEELPVTAPTTQRSPVTQEEPEVMEVPPSITL
jgi:hypothetical protein